MATSPSDRTGRSPDVPADADAEVGLAAQMLALHDLGLTRALDKYRAGLRDKVMRSVEELRRGVDEAE